MKYFLSYDEKVFISCRPKLDVLVERLTGLIYRKDGITLTACDRRCQPGPTWRLLETRELSNRRNA